MLNIISHQGNENEDDDEIPLHTVRMTTIKNQRTTSVGKDMGEREPLHAVGKNAYGAATMGTIWRLLKKIKNRVIIDPVVPTLGMHPKELKPGSPSQPYS